MTAAQPVISLSKKQSLAWEYLEDSTTTEVFFGGAAGPGKTYLGCIWHIYRRASIPGSRGLIGRAKLSVLKQSTLVTFFKAAGNMGYRANIDFVYNATEHIVVWKNGSVTIFKDLFYYPSDPDFTSLGSFECTDAFIDEATEVTERAVEIVATRIRWMIPEAVPIPKMLLTSNPGPGWVKEKFVQDKERRPIELKPYQKFVPALVTDNPDPEFVKLYSEQLSKLKSDYDKRRLLHGDWDAEREVSDAFATQYDPAIHEDSAAVFRPGERLYISIDFNLSPFAVSFGHIFSDQDGPHFHIFDCIKIEHGSMQKMIRQIKERYKNQLPNCIITGDSVGNNRQLGQEDNASYYRQLMVGLGLRSKQVIVPHNPNHRVSREDCNYFLAHFPDFKINPERCPDLCMDMRNVECDAFGDIIKTNRHNIHQRADFLDNFRYFINTFFKTWVVKHQK